jgi:hypothetical protein
VVITNASNVVATTFTGALAGTAANATGLVNSPGAAPVYGARAWVNFDGTRDTSGAVSTANTNRLIRAQGNVSSVLRNGTGDYTVNFTTAMVDANYCALAIGSYDSQNFGPSGEIKTRATGSLRFETRYQPNNTLYDHDECHAAIFR